MRRRELLGKGALAGAGALGVGASGCAPAWPAALEPGVMPLDMPAFMATLDARMRGMEQARFVEGFVESVGRAPLRPEHASEIQRRDKLFQRMLRTLYVTQTFRDLPEEAQRHPGMQQRMFQHLGEIDSTVAEVTELLAKSSDRDHVALQKALRRDRDLGMKIGAAIDQQAALAGVSAKRRVQLRGMMKQASFRLSHAPPKVVINEYVEKAERLSKASAQPGGLSLAAQAGTDLFWGMQAAAAAPGATPVPPSSPRGTTALKTGGVLLGLGLVVGGVSAAIASSGATGFLIGLTVGAILFAIGFVMLIVGALIYIASESE